MWKIIEQEETVGRSTTIVQCKALRFFPVEKPGLETVFKALGFPVLQIIVEHSSGERLRLKCSTKDGILHCSFVLQREDKMEHPTMIVGEGKRRREVPDLLSPKVKKAGEKEHYATVFAFKERIKFLGIELSGRVLLLFAQRLAQIEQKRLKKSKKVA